MEFERLGPKTVVAAFGSVATNGSAATVLYRAPVKTQVVGAAIVNGLANAVASGTTAGSAATFSVYKNASTSSSRVGTFNGSGTTIATAAVQTITLSTSTALLQLAAGDILIAEMIGGAANNVSNAGLIICVDIVAGYETGTTPSAGTGPA